MFERLVRSYKKYKIKKVLTAGHSACLVDKRPTYKAVIFTGKNLDFFKEEVNKDAFVKDNVLVIPYSSSPAQANIGDCVVIYPHDICFVVKLEELDKYYDPY